MSRKVPLSLLFLLTLCICITQGQNAPESIALESHDKGALAKAASAAGVRSAGLGFGLAYGGFGARLGFYPIQDGYLNVGVGYLHKNLGYNVGYRQAIPGRSIVQFYVAGNYGSNAIITNSGGFGSSRVFGGFSFGSGVIFKLVKRPGSQFVLGVVRAYPSKAFERSVNQSSLSIEQNDFGLELGFQLGIR